MVKIFNLLTYKINPKEQSLLVVCPKNDAKSFDLYLDLHRFTRKSTLCRHFSIQDQKGVHSNNEIMTKQQEEERIGK